MKQLQQIEQWINKETEVKMHEIRRYNRTLACLVYVFLVYGALVIMDSTGFVLFDIQPLLSLTYGTVLEVPVQLMIVAGIITFAVLIIFPAAWLLFTSSKVLDKEYVNDPARTRKWHEKKERKKNR